MEDVHKPPPIGRDARCGNLEPHLREVLHDLHQGARAVGRLDSQNRRRAVRFVIDFNLGRVDPQLQRLILQQEPLPADAGAAVHARLLLAILVEGPQAGRPREVLVSVERVHDSNSLV